VCSDLQQYLCLSACKILAGGRDRWSQLRDLLLAAPRKGSSCRGVEVGNPHLGLPDNNMRNAYGVTCGAGRLDCQTTPARAAHAAAVSSMPLGVPALR
jgi:hypothetical protein